MEIFNDLSRLGWMLLFLFSSCYLIYGLIKLLRLKRKSLFLAYLSYFIAVPMVCSFVTLNNIYLTAFAPLFFMSFTWLFLGLIVRNDLKKIFNDSFIWFFLVGSKKKRSIGVLMIILYPMWIYFESLSDNFMLNLGLMMISTFYFTITLSFIVQSIKL